MSKNFYKASIHSRLSVPLMNGTITEAFGCCTKEDVENLADTGMNSGLESVNPNPSSVDESWTLVCRNPKAVKVKPAGEDMIVTWADIARLKAGMSGGKNKG